MRTGSSCLNAYNQQTKSDPQPPVASRQGLFGTDLNKFACRLYFVSEQVSTRAWRGGAEGQGQGVGRQESWVWACSMPRRWLWKRMHASTRCTCYSMCNVIRICAVSPITHACVRTPISHMRRSTYTHTRIGVCVTYTSYTHVCTHIMHHAANPPLP